MTTIMPEGELIRRAFAYILEELELHPEINRRKLIDEASMRYNLSPIESTSLLNMIKEEKPTQS